MNRSSSSGRSTVSAETTSAGAAVRMRLTRISKRFPVSERRIPGTEMISSGTWRGDATRRTAAAIYLSTKIVVEPDTVSQVDK
jgi:hypothetical protein